MKRKFYQIQPASFSEFGVANHRDLWAKVKSAGYQGLSVQVPLTLTKAKDQDKPDPGQHTVVKQAREY